MTSYPSTEALELAELREALTAFGEPYKTRYIRILNALAARLSQAEAANASLRSVLEDLEWSVLPPPLPRCPSCGYMEGRGNYYKRPGSKGGHDHSCKLGAALAASSAGEAG